MCRFNSGLQIFRLSAVAVADQDMAIWDHTLQHNTSLTDLTLKIFTFSSGSIYPFRIALRMNASLSEVDLKLGSFSIKTVNMLPRSDRRLFRALLGLVDASSSVFSSFSAGTRITRARSSHGHAADIDQSFYIPVADLLHSPWRSIGQGNFGQVMEGQLHSQPICIKVFRAPEWEYSRIDNIKMQVNEFALVQELGEDQVRALSASCVFATHFSIDDREVESLPAILVVLPLMHSTLNRELPTATSDTLLQLLVQLADALHSLHQAGVLHRDVASRNVLLERRADGKLVAKLCDFGLACAISSPWQPELFPAGIWAPEMVASAQLVPYGVAADVWAFGLLLVDVLGRGQTQSSAYVPHAWFSSL
jgi:hypothetical protein